MMVEQVPTNPAQAALPTTIPLLVVAAWITANMSTLDVVVGCGVVVGPGTGLPVVVPSRFQNPSCCLGTEHGEHAFENEM